MWFQRFCFLLFGLLFWATDSLSIENNKKLFHSFYHPDLFEINKVVFKGNSFVSSEKLQGLISSKPTKKSLPHRALFFYYENVARNRAAPKLLASSLKSIVLSLANEISFFKEPLAENDKQTIYNFYFQNGFHDVAVDYRFYPDSIEKINVLEFSISEGVQYRVDFIAVQGLDSLSPEVEKEIRSVKKVSVGEPFNEELLAEELTAIRVILRNNGYFYADFLSPRVVIDTLKKIDSVYIEFRTGKPVRIGHINFIDSVGNQKRVGFNVKYNNLDIKPGDLFSQKKLLSSEINLSSLGTFELVRIDTSSAFHPFTDSTINLAVLLNYRKLRDYGVGLFTNRTTAEKAINIGFEFTISDRNIFGGAQSASFFLRAFGIDISRVIFERKSLEYEFQTGVNFLQPLLWIIGNTRVGLSSSILYSRRKVFGSLQLNTFTFPLKFSSRLPLWTYFNYIDFDFYFERQVPKNFATASQSFFSNANSFEDSLRIQQSIAIFGNLDRYINTYHPLLTTSIFGINFTGDTRDNPLIPRRGRLTNLSFDGYFFFGMAKYYRFNFSSRWFWDLTNFFVLGARVQTGYIYWFDKKNSFVPFERHFFVGGANSVRGWASRQLRYFKGFRLDTSSSAIVNSFLRDFVGNSTLFETSLEARFRFGRPSYIGKTFADILELFTVTLFFDAGNAYQWLIQNEKGDYYVKYTLGDYIRGIACATGFGIGFITPAGPFFLDVGFPVYDPNGEKRAFASPVFHIRLGYAF